jgi:phosphoserine phosphatase RsbU/P
MKILVAEDDPTARKMLEFILAKENYEVISVADGLVAWERLRGPNAPKIAVLDWMMPGMNGVELCRKLRQDSTFDSLYIILLTMKNTREDVVLGLGSGANDYIRKPFNRQELIARIQVGERFVDLQETLENKMNELKDALSKIKTLRGLLPICSYCRKIRNDQEYWQGLESYISDTTGADFSHGICPECFSKHITPQINSLADAPKNP